MIVLLKFFYYVNKISEKDSKLGHKNISKNYWLEWRNDWQKKLLNCIKIYWFGIRRENANEKV